jgi:hypothetical protein
VLVWGRLRAAPRGSSQRAEIQWAPAAGAFRTVQEVTVAGPSDVLAARVTVPGPGALRITWVSPGGQRLVSRVVALLAR